MFAIPLVMIVIGYIVYLKKYKISEEFYSGILRDIEERENALEKLSAVFAEHLIEALRPTETLSPRLSEGFGLFIVNYRAAAVAYLNATNRHIG